MTPEERDQMRKAMVPASVQEAVAAIKATPALDLVNAWVGSKTSTLALLGPVGCGKTVAACWAILSNFRTHAVFMRTPGDMPPQKFWLGATFVSLAELAAASLWDPQDRTLRERCEATRLLILDDAGTERGDGAAAVDQLVTGRMAEKRRTILTSNLLPSKFSARYGTRVIDRIMGDGEIHSLTGPSLRSKTPAPLEVVR